ncbi:helix-turn-helix transcriptional regulator [Burkholderia contaminans]|uniref:helix-turn-helix transcriptional regulator n=1 Tax=Burkholderia contaminans TaxID=488447 RepID=UPI001589C253|nr:LuxR C-terminal-related transcriptional regulator [Burkholderia contaminans]
MSSAPPIVDIHLGQLSSTACALGAIADAVGTRQFLPVLFETISNFVDCDSLHLDYVQPCSMPRNICWIGSFGKDPELIERTMQLYYQSYAQSDSTFDRIECERDVQLMQLSDRQVESRLRSIFYDVADIHDECVTYCLTRGVQFSMSVCRARRLPPFSLKELSILKHLALIVLPLAAMHESLVGAKHSGKDGSGTPSDTITRWLNEKLTPREAQVCSAFIQGMTTQAIAISMGVKPSTVETFAKRAFIKLEIDSRRQLLALAFNNALVAPSCPHIN